VSIQLKSIASMAALILAAAFLRPAISQQSTEPDANQRIVQSMSQLVASLSIKRGMEADPECSPLKFRKIPVDEYVQLMKEMDDKNIPGVGKSKTPPNLEELKQMISKLPEVEVPNQGITWKIMYDTMRKNISNSNPALRGGQSLCDALNNASEGLFQKSKDNIRLIGSK
jgi:hypothetical protein